MRGRQQKWVEVVGGNEQKSKASRTAQADEQKKCAFRSPYGIARSRVVGEKSAGGRTKDRNRVHLLLPVYPAHNNKNKNSFFMQQYSSSSVPELYPALGLSVSLAHRAATFKTCQRRGNLSLLLGGKEIRNNKTEGPRAVALTHGPTMWHSARHPAAPPTVSVPQ